MLDVQINTLGLIRRGAAKVSRGYQPDIVRSFVTATLAAERAFAYGSIGRRVRARLVRTQTGSYEKERQADQE